MDEQERSTWIPVGEHVFREEPADDLMFVRLRGTIVPEQAPLLAAPLRAFIRDGRTRLFLVIDMSELGYIPSEARKSLAQAVLDLPIAAAAIFGTTFAQRVIATLADRTNNVVRGGRRYETRFFSTEEQGRAWLTRKRLEQAKPSGGA